MWSERDHTSAFYSCPLINEQPRLIQEFSGAHTFVVIVVSCIPVEVNRCFLVEIQVEIHNKIRLCKLMSFKSVTKVRFTGHIYPRRGGGYKHRSHCED